MQSYELISSIEDPKKLIENLKNLSELVKKYPYFHTAQRMYLKALFANKHFHYNLQLRVAAMHSRDRNKMHTDVHTYADQAAPIFRGKVEDDQMISIAESKGTKPTTTIEDVKNTTIPDLVSTDNNLNAEIIGDFIENEQKIIKKVKQTTRSHMQDSADDFAIEDKSTEESKSHYNPTYAELLIKQEAYGKAIEVYDYLCTQDSYPDYDKELFKKRIENIKSKYQ